MLTIRVCVVCGNPLRIRQKTTCSFRCRSRRIMMLHPQQGENNFNFKGWSSKRPVEYTRRFKRLNPEKARAHLVVAEAIRKGFLVRPEECDSCLRLCKPDAHHEDYEQPLTVEWLCRKCHAAKDRMRHASDSARLLRIQGSEESSGTR